MGGTQSAEWWRAYRARNRERLNAQLRARRAVSRVRGDRSAEYAKRVRRIDTEPLPLLMPALQHGGSVAFWEDELRLDLAQEHAALHHQGIRGKDRQRYLTAYRTREVNEMRFFLSLDILPFAAVEQASPVETARHRASPGERTPAICHDGRWAASDDLCHACFAFAKRARLALDAGRITPDEARERVRRRVRGPNA